MLMAWTTGRHIFKAPALPQAGWVWALYIGAQEKGGESQPRDSRKTKRKVVGVGPVILNWG